MEKFLKKKYVDKSRQSEPLKGRQLNIGGEGLGTELDKLSPGPGSDPFLLLNFVANYLIIWYISLICKM